MDSIKSVLLLIFFFATLANSADSSGSVADGKDVDSLVTVALTDGSVLQGTIVTRTASQTTIKTIGGLEITFPTSSVESIRPLEGRVVDGGFLKFDPNYSRLLYAPTGRPLEEGHGYITNTWVIFPAIGIGFTDNVTIIGGMSIVPGVSFKDQIKYIAPKVGARVSDNLALSVGTIYFRCAGKGAGVLWGVGTWGKRDLGLTVGAGIPYIGSDFSDVRILMIGGSIRATNSVALVTENWFLFDDGTVTRLYSAAIRFFGSRLAGDMGFLFNRDLLREGFPIPWLSLTYNFGH